MNIKGFTKTSSVYKNRHFDSYFHCYFCRCEDTNTKKLSGFRNKSTFVIESKNRLDGLISQIIKGTLMRGHIIGHEEHHPEPKCL